MPAHAALPALPTAHGYDTRWGRLRTAWSEYRHPNGHRVVLLGCIHIGSPPYYRRLNDLLTDYVASGFVVHYERLRRPAKEKEEAATDDERDLLKRFLEADTAFRALAVDTLGLRLQVPWEGMDDNWRNTDLDTLDFVRAHPDGAIERHITMINRLVTFLRRSPAWTRPLYRAVGLAALAGMGPLQGLLEWIEDSYPEVRRDLAREFIIDRRNELAMDTTLAEPRNVVLPWGAGHYRGMAARLRVEGYDLIAHTMIPMR